jgi:Dyp-type peroxidase family
MLEGALEVDEIQGNGLAGFNKDYQAFLFLRISPDDGAPAAVRAWVAALAPQISSLREVHAFNQLFRILRRRLGRDPVGVGATWMNIAFSREGIMRLVSAEDADLFLDEAFKAGLAQNSPDLGDPSDASAEGNPVNWMIGGPGNEADILIILASDFPEMLASRITSIRTQLETATASDGLPLSGYLKIVYLQPGQTLPAPLTGHEHFGFRDGISQPGARGKLDENQYLTPRILAGAQDNASLPEFSRPGQPLVWPGQFVFGYPRQSDEDPQMPMGFDAESGEAAPEYLPGPNWARNGSYVVVRRLRQDVPAFQAAVADAVRQAAAQGLTVTADETAALMVGRWPGGAPLMRSPLKSDPDLAANGLAVNHFAYVNDTEALSVLPGNGPPDTFPQASGDFVGARCPLSAHVRKVNPRDTITEQGRASDTLRRLVLRRGIPYGSPIPEWADEDDPVQSEDRGLMFVSYQSSIVDQFAFLQRQWANNALFPSDGGGQDPLIGQQEQDGKRIRFFDLAFADSASVTVELDGDWVIPTGGGYFFSPSISSLTTVFGK